MISSTAIITFPSLLGTGFLKECSSGPATPAHYSFKKYKNPTLHTSRSPFLCFFTTIPKPTLEGTPCNNNFGGEF